MCNKKRVESTEIGLRITDLVLTPATCALLINEILKYLVYQKSQIPYPYAWLKSVINRKRKCLESGETRHSIPSVSRNYNAASTAYDVIEEIAKNVTLQFKENGNNISELVITFGVTPHSPKEIFKFVIPKLDIKHVDINHIIANDRNKNKVLRNLFLSEDWMNAMEFGYPCTNMYLLINKRTPSATDESAFFLPMRNYELNESVRHITVRFLYHQYDGLCCLDLHIFNDTSDHKDKNCEIKEAIERKGIINNYWYQAKLILKGFKDCYVNRQSASDLF